MKKCPYCAEEIQDDAIKCKHCGELLSPATRGSIDSREGSPLLRIVGALLLILGAGAAAYYFRFFDTSVEVPIAGGILVNNLGLMQERQNGLMFGAGGAVVGLCLLLYAQRRGAAKR